MSRALVASTALLLALAASCSRDPEDFCVGWVEKTCEALSSCCHGGRQFDRVACHLQFSNACQNMTQAEQVRSGTAVFDSGAASVCLDSESCTNIDWATPHPVDFEHKQACANMVTGVRPLGAMCHGDTDCARAGEYATCYLGRPGLEALDPGGFCAKVVLDDARCGYSFDDNELHQCPDDRFCDLVDVDLLESTSVLERAYYFSAPCRPRVAEGASCIDTRNDSDLLPCREGLYCEVTGENQGTCKKRKSNGASCDPAFDVGECAEGMHCVPDATNGGATCKKPKTIPFACVPPCGDGKCSSGETAESCPEDCAGAP